LNSVLFHHKNRESGGIPRPKKGGRAKDRLLEESLCPMDGHPTKQEKELLAAIAELTVLKN
jgi:hypothetical protein